MSGSKDEEVGGLHLTHIYDTRLTNFWDKEPAVRAQGRGCIPSPPARALLGTPTGGHYLDPGYQHEGHHRLSLHTKSSARIDPGTEIRNAEQPEERSASQASNRPKKGPLPRRPKVSLEEESMPGTTQPGNEDSRKPEGRYGMTTEKARALPDTLGSIWMSCRGLYQNPGFSPRPTEFLLALLKNRITVGT